MMLDGFTDRCLRCRYVEEENELRHALCSLHLAETQPHAIILDSPHLLRSSRPGTTTEQSPTSQHPKQRSSQQPSPTSHRPARRNEGMQLSCVIALAAHAADYLSSNRTRRPEESLNANLPYMAEGQTAPPIAPCLLCVGLTEALLEPEVTCRWLHYDLEARHPLGAQNHQYTLTCSHRPTHTECASISFSIGRSCGIEI